MTIKHILVSVACVACVSLSFGATNLSAQQFGISWFSIDGGGGYSTGNNFELNGTIGQPDAGEVMTGGEFELAGGFGAGRVILTPILGDANGDGMLNNGDIGAFVLALTNPAAYQATYPNVDPDVVLDMNGDGFFNNGDIGGFVAALTGGGKK